MGRAHAGLPRGQLALHIGAAWLVYADLRQAQDSRRVLAAAIFALHPVHVESVAWVTEQKNTLSAVFYLGAMLAYLHFDETRRRSWYRLGVGAVRGGAVEQDGHRNAAARAVGDFLVAAGQVVLASATLCRCCRSLRCRLSTACSPPGSSEGHRRRRRGLRADAAPKALLAGRAILVLPGKTVLAGGPDVRLSALGAGPEQKPGSGCIRSRLLAVLAGLWAVRKRWRAPLAGALFFIGTLFPVLGFLNVFFFRYSFVSDHFPYLASLGVIVPAAAGITLGLRRVAPAHPNLGPLVGVAIVAILAVLTWRQTDLYAHDLVYFWKTTIAQNPAAPMPRTNLATTFLAKGGSPENAIQQLQEALRLDPTFPDAHNNMGVGSNG